MAKIKKKLYHIEILTNDTIGNLKCGILVSRKRLIVEQNGLNFWTQGTTVHICRDTFDAQFLEFGLGSFGALCKFSKFTIF